jgi:hypothetical protein
MKTGPTIAAQRCRGDVGITMIELLIAIALTGIMMAPLGAAIYFGLRTTTSTEDRVTQSNGANLMASYFLPDVQGAVEAGTTESVAICGAGAGPASLVLKTSDTTSVSYYQGTGTKSTTLYRRTCANGAPTGIARVASSLAQPPDFVCDTSNCFNFRTVTATLVQGAAAGGSPYQTRLEAARRATA